MDTTNHVDVIIHVDETLSDKRRAKLVSNLQCSDGVNNARFAPGRDHLMVIDYDPNKLHTSEVLTFVKEENVNAELIGI
jgi:hypothetical protein